MQRQTLSRQSTIRQGQHAHIISAGTYAYPGRYDNLYQAERQAARLRRSEDIDAAVDPYCDNADGRCPWCATTKGAA